MKEMESSYAPRRRGRSRGRSRSRSRSRSGGEVTTPAACFALCVGCLLVEGRSLPGRESSCVGTVGGHRSVVTHNKRGRKHNNNGEGNTITMGKAVQ